MVTTMKEAVKEIFETFLHFMLGIAYLEIVIPYIFALICFVLFIITVVKREPRSIKCNFIVEMWNIYAIFEIIRSLLHRHEASDVGMLLLMSCALFKIAQQVFSEKKHKLILICDVIVCVCCTASLTLSIIELVSR